MESKRHLIQKTISDQINRRVIQELQIQMGYIGKYAGKNKNFQRNCCLTFQCTNCTKRWTTSKGTIEIQFNVADNKKKLFIKVTAFLQKCLACKTYGKPSAKIQQLNWVIDQFIQIVSNIINDIPRVHKKTGVKEVKLLQDHKSQLCEACSLGKCSQSNPTMKKTTHYNQLSNLMRKLNLY